MSRIVITPDVLRLLGTVKNPLAYSWVVSSKALTKYLTLTYDVDSKTAKLVSSACKEAASNTYVRVDVIVLEVYKIVDGRLVNVLVV